MLRSCHVFLLDHQDQLRVVVLHPVEVGLGLLDGGQHGFVGSHPELISMIDVEHLKLVQIMAGVEVLRDVTDDVHDEVGFEPQVDAVPVRLEPVPDETPAIAKILIIKGFRLRYY